jgi:hypothetical protein
MPLDRRRGLQPCRRIDHVPGRHPRHRLRRPETTSASPVLMPTRTQVEAGLVVVQGGDRSSIARAARTALRSSSWAIGAPNRGHHGVADELLDCATIVLQPLPEERMVRSKGATYILYVHALAAAGEADQVSEQHRHHLAPSLTARRTAPHRRRRRTGTSGFS